MSSTTHVRPCIWLPACLPSFTLFVVGSAIALFLPVAAFVFFRLHVVAVPIADGEPLVVTGAHRWVAVIGVAVAAWSMCALSRRAAAAPESLSSPGRWIAMAAFVGVVFFNIRWAGVKQGMWGWWLPELSRAYLPCLGLFGLSALLSVRKTSWPKLISKEALLAAGVGFSYGAFSVLWHCCPPLWEDQGAPPVLFALGTFGWMMGLSVFTVGIATRFPSHSQYFVGGIVFAIGYPWHTPLWFLHGVIGGALMVWVARRTGSIVTAGVLLIIAYATHTTLPPLLP